MVGVADTPSMMTSFSGMDGVAQQLFRTQLGCYSDVSCFSTAKVGGALLHTRLCHVHPPLLSKDPPSL